MVPDTTYIDGVDQTGFLLADNGQSNRYSRIYTYNQYFAMVRLDEFKFIFTTEVQNGLFQRGDWGGFSGSVVTETGGATMVNLYTNPQEDVNIGVRHLPAYTRLTPEVSRYRAVLKKYPPQFRVGFAGNP
jgi:arylsulfatase